MKPDKITDFLNQYPLFENLSDEEREQLRAMAKLKKIPRHASIYEEGMPSHEMYFLLEGIVKIGTHSDDGREAIKFILHPMAMFGEMGLMGQSERMEHARTMNEDTYCLVVNVSDFKLLMQQNFLLSQQMLERIGKRLMRVEQRLESLIFQDARTRIVEFLKENALQRGRQVGFEMLFKHCLTQQDIANITGTSRQTVTSVLNELKKENLIHFNRRTILIRDMKKLA